MKFLNARTRLQVWFLPGAVIGAFYASEMTGKQVRALEFYRAEPVFAQAQPGQGTLEAPPGANPASLVSPGMLHIGVFQLPLLACQAMLRAALFSCFLA